MADLSVNLDLLASTAGSLNLLIEEFSNASDAARIAVAAVSQPGSPFDEIRFVLFSDGMLDAFSAALGSRAGE